MPPGVTGVMTRLAFLVVLIVSLALPSSAASKEVQSVTACGVGDCATSKNAGVMRGMGDIGPPAGGPEAPAPFYRLTVAVGDGDESFGHFKSWWVPSAGRLLNEDGRWLTVRPVVRRALARLTRGLEALPSARLPGFPAADEHVTPPRAATTVTPDSDLPAVPLVVGAVVLLALVGVLVRRRVIGRGPYPRTRPEPQ